MNIKHQDQRNLHTILKNSNHLEQWRKSWQKLGFQSLEHFEMISQLPIMLISSNICHSQKVQFFVEEYNYSGYACNKIRNDDLDQAPPSVVISIPGINFKYSPLQPSKLIENGIAELCISNMWENILESAMIQGCKNISIPPIGLGAFLPLDQTDASNIADLYFKTLFKLLSDPKYHGKFDGIFYNAYPFNKQCQKMLMQYKDSIDCPVKVHSKDAKFLATNLSEAGYMCAVVNPSDMDVVLGLHDVGEYYKNGDYAMEEDIASTSTAFIGSTGISDVYKDKNRIQNSSSNINSITVKNLLGKIFKKSPAPKFKSSSGIKKDKVTIYSAKPEFKNDIKVGIIFETKQSRDDFIAKMNAEARRLNTQGLPLSTWHGNDNVAYINAGRFDNSIGTYKSNSNGQLAIEFGNKQLRDFFISTLKITTEHADIPGNTNTLYFDKSKLPPEPNISKNITIQRNPEVVNEYKKIKQIKHREFLATTNKRTDNNTSKISIDSISSRKTSLEKSAKLNTYKTNTIVDDVENNYQKIANRIKKYENIDKLYNSRRSQSKLKSFFAFFGHKGRKEHHTAIKDLKDAIKTFTDKKDKSSFDNLTSVIESSKKIVKKGKFKLGSSSLASLLVDIEKEINSTPNIHQFRL